MKNEVTFAAAELKGLEIKTAKNGKSFAKGVLYLTNENGGYQASFPMFCFSAAVATLSALEQQEHSADLVGGVSVTESDGTKSEPNEPRRPIANVSGWFRSKQVDGVWRTSFMLESVN